MTIEAEIRKSVLEPFRKAYIRRRLNDGSGDYETDWFDITNLIKIFGIVSWSTDDIQLNQFEQPTVTLTSRNDNKEWTEGVFQTSLFEGFLTRYKTLVRINAGYLDEDGNELPTNTAVFYGIITDEVTLNSENEAIIRVNALSWTLEEQSAGDIGSLASETATSLAEKIRDIQDGSSNFTLQRYISSTAWNIETTTTVYTDITTDSLNSLNCWELIGRLAEAENFVTYIDNNGGLSFRAKDANTASSLWTFNGPGIRDTTYGVNIVSLDDLNPGWSQIYNRIRVKHLDENTETSYVTAETSWTVGDGSTQDKYGTRTYEFENTWLDQTGASILAAQMLNNLNAPKDEYLITTKMITHLNLFDRVTLNWYGEPILANPSYWGRSYWSNAASPNKWYWSGRRGGILIRNKECKIIRIDIDLDNFQTQFKLKEI